jgi:hypothetical protein
MPDQKILYIFVKALAKESFEDTSLKRSAFVAM